MRRSVLLLPLVLVACNKEPSFDERYAKAANEVQARAKAMDEDIVKSDAAAKAAGADAGGNPVPGTAVRPGGKIPPTDPVPLPDTVKPSNAPPSSGE